jgi:hypothetical protein
MQLSSSLSITVGSRSSNCFRSRDWNKHFPQRCNRELLWEARTGIAYHDQNSSLASRPTKHYFQPLSDRGLK